jgi:hypothetical protein
MFFGNSVQETRQLFYSSWEKYHNKLPLLALEQQLVDVIIVHPEYHSLLETPRDALDEAYFPELGATNPFLHMGLHLAIRDQVTLNRPSGITEIYHQLVHQYKDNTVVEHLLMEPLIESLWQSQRNQQRPDEQLYLNACRKLLGGIE